MKRWPPKPAPGQKCDTYTGDYDTGVSFKPVVGGRCSNEAVETVFSANSSLGIPMWLCADCVARLGEKIVRNPKRRPA